jgi:uncharacterized integral membrane protein
VRLGKRTAGLEERYQARLWLVLGGLGLLVAYVLYFVLANDDEVSVDFLFFDATTGLIWVILLSLAIGVIAGLLLSQLYRRRSTSSATPSEMRSGDS